MGDVDEGHASARTRTIVCVEWHARAKLPVENLFLQEFTQLYPMKELYCQPLTGSHDAKFIFANRHFLWIPSLQTGIDIVRITRLTQRWCGPPADEVSVP